MSTPVQNRAMAVDWCLDSEFEAEARRSGSPRNIFFGSGKYAKFLRTLASDHHRRHGVVWCTWRQHAFVFVEDVIVDARATLPALRKTLDRVVEEAQFRAEAATYHEGMDAGPVFAHALFESPFGRSVLEIDIDSPIPERDLAKVLRDHQYLLGISWFLMSGWDALSPPEAGT